MIGKVFFNGVEMPTASVSMQFEYDDPRELIADLRPAPISSELLVQADEETIARYFVEVPEEPHS